MGRGSFCTNLQNVKMFLYIFFFFNKIVLKTVTMINQERFAIKNVVQEY